MNKTILNKYIDKYLEEIKSGEINDIEERNQRKIYYQSFNKEKIINKAINTNFEKVDE